MRANEWVNFYIGLPFADGGRARTGVDCWGLVRLVYAEQLGIELPSYLGEYASATDASVSAVMEREASSWSTVHDLPRKYDVVMLRIGARPRHVGIIVSDGLMLHVERGKDACIERYSGIMWISRVEGFYRHVR